MDACKEHSRFASQCRYFLSPLVFSVRRQPYYKFLLVSLVCSATLELPRFFEFEPSPGPPANFTDYQTTELMEDTDYIQFNSYWNELFATGALPLFSLAYMNFRRGFRCKLTLAHFRGT